MTHTQWYHSHDHLLGQASVPQTTTNLDSTHLLLPRRLAGAKHEEAIDDPERLRPLRRFELRKVNTSFHAHNFTDGRLPFGVVRAEKERCAPCLALLFPSPRCQNPPPPRATWRLARLTKTHPSRHFWIFYYLPFIPASFGLPQCWHYWSLKYKEEWRMHSPYSIKKDLLTHPCRQLRIFYSLPFTPKSFCLSHCLP